MILNGAFDINKANRAESLSFCCIFGLGGFIYLFIWFTVFNLTGK